MKAPRPAVAVCACLLLAMVTMIILPPWSGRRVLLRLDRSGTDFGPNSLKMSTTLSAVKGAAATEETRLADFSGNPYKVGPTIRVAPTIPEAEEHIAVDPSDSKNLVAAVIDLSRGQGSQTLRYAFSTQNGAADAWKGDFVNLFGNLALRTSDGNFWAADVDPAVVIDGNQNVYLVQLYKDVFARDNGELKQIQGTTGIYVSRQDFSKLGDDGFKQGKNRTVPVAPPDLDPTKQIAEDKPWIAVDQCSGDVYVAWAHFGHRGTAKESSQIYFSRSTNQGMTWSPVVKLSRLSPTTSDSGAQVAAMACGEVFVAWVETSNTTRPGELFSSRLILAVSDDNGQHFGIPKPITQSFLSVFTPFPDAFYKVNAFPSMAVDLRNNSLALVYSAALNNDPSNPNTQVKFILSTDNGQTFSEPQTINDVAAGEHFFPAITTDAEGVYHACWFDTRNSQRDNRLLDVYATYTKDGGATFGKNAKVTQPMNPRPGLNVGSADFIGDYIGIAAGGNFAHPVWSNISKNGAGELTGSLQTATITLP